MSGGKSAGSSALTCSCTRSLSASRVCVILLEAQGYGTCTPSPLCVGRASLIPSGSMAPGRSARGVVVRHGHCTAHVRTVAEAADLMRSLAGHAASGEERPVLGVAGVICSAAAEATAALGHDTVARGWQALRAAGRRPNAAPERAVRELDAASALIRHPTAAGRTLDRLRGWLAADGVPEDTRAHRCGGQAVLERVAVSGGKCGERRYHFAHAAAHPRPRRGGRREHRQR